MPSRCSAGAERSDAPSRGRAHAEPIVRFFCSTFGDGIAGVGVNEDGFVVITAEFRGDGLVEASIAVGPESTCACRISTGDTHLASTAPDARSFEVALKSRLAEIGVHRRDDPACA